MQEYKDYRDAENIMPLATSDFRNPVCQELRSMRESSMETSGYGDYLHELYQPEVYPTEVYPAEIYPAENYEQEIYAQSPIQSIESTVVYTKTYADRGSVDSSDTYASCQTHPFHSQADLTDEADSNLYINPLEGTDKCGKMRVKKSTSSEHVTRNIIDVSPSTESLKGLEFPQQNESAKVSLIETLPKHKKIRIQKVSPKIPSIFYFETI